MSTAVRQPSVDTVRKRGGIGHCYVEATVGLQHASNLGEGFRQIYNVLQTVICDDTRESFGGKRQVRGIGGYEVLRPFTRCFQV